MKRSLVLTIVALLLCASPVLAQETPQSTQVPTEVVATAEPTPTVIDEIQDEAETNLTAMVIAAISLVVLFLCVVLTFAVVQIGRSVPASFAGVYFNTAYAGQRLLNSRIDDLAKEAAKSEPTWDDDVVAIAKKYTDEQLKQLVEIARERGVIIGDGEPQG